MSFDIYEKDLYERQIRIPRLKQLYETRNLLTIFSEPIVIELLIFFLKRCRLDNYCIKNK